ncbi:mechanosensitive ion channel family protein [Psychrobacter jeotgali]|uniref:mechanosensitive ion channel family protein n=1 Tax=Psychrobacter jeotgali TaxID=179010 RepID=UPI0019194364|nr:mechanosensitive ion channel family protein [Psychrobacter jeotgali]
MPLIIFLLITTFSLISFPLNAATNEGSAAANSSNLQTQAGLQPQAHNNPDGLIEYIGQEIEALKEQGLDLPDSVSEALESTEKVEAAKQADKLQAESELKGKYNENYYLLDELNTGLSPLSPPPNLLTPMATLEFFHTAATLGNFELAAYALNMNLFDLSTQSTRGAELAERFDFLLNRKNLYTFSKLPDRPDGLVEPPFGGGTNIHGIARRSIRLGNIEFHGQRIPIFVERVKVNDNTPVWVFSAQTVSHIDKLYEQYKPAEFERYLPNLLTMRFFGIAVWELLALLTFLMTTMGLGWVVSRLTGKFINYFAKDEDLSKIGYKKSLTELINKFTVPLTFTISFSLVFILVSGGFPFIEAIATSTRPIIWIALVISVLWLGIRIINFFANRYEDIQIESLDEEAYDEYRRRSTYLSIFRRVFIFVMVLGSIWIGLSEFVNLEGLGKTLLTSAGILSVIIGIAAQPTLGNIVAGIQIAMTQPVRIGDTIMYEGNWSTIEDLGYTYATIKTWDERRLFVPMRHFVSHTVENWSHPESHQTRTISLLVDYGINVDDIRQKYIEVVKASEYWDGKTEPMLQVLSVARDTIELYGTLAAQDPNQAWMLECEVRERMLAYLYDKQTPYLPAERVALQKNNIDE